MRRMLLALVLLACACVVQAADAPFDVEKATQAYLETVPAEQRARADAYFEGGYGLQVADFAIGVAINLGLLAFGLSRRMRDLGGRWFRRPVLSTLAYWVMYAAITTVVVFPYSLYKDFFREHAYGLSNQSLADWLGDQGKGFLVGLLLGGLAVSAVYAVVRRLPRTWVLWGAGTSLAFLVFVILITPVFVSPLFNDYTRLQDPVVARSVLGMARAQGVMVDDVWVFDASRQTKRISANVSGLWHTQRISLNDNLLNRTSLAEIESVMGHELGHYVLNHAHKSIVFFGVVIVIGFAFLKWAFERLVARRGAAWGVRGADDPAGLPLAMTIISAYFFVLTPVLNTHVRSQEAEADLFGINASGQPDGEAIVDMRLAEYRKLDPGPIEEMLLFDHPSGRSRVLMAMRWKAEHLQESEVNARRAADGDRERGWSPEYAEKWAKEKAPK